jgi:hypothetical protein
MATTDIRLKKLYDSMGSMISTLHLQKGNLSHEEMYCLLSLLDYILMGKSDPSFTALLREWQTSNLEPEINEIIKATLLSIDFKKTASVAKNMEIIRGLIMYNNNLKDS